MGIQKSTDVLTVTAAGEGGFPGPMHATHNARPKSGAAAVDLLEMTQYEAIKDTG